SLAACSACWSWREVLAQPPALTRWRRPVRHIGNGLARPPRNFVQTNQLLVGFARADDTISAPVDEDLRHEKSRIISSGLHRAIGAGRHNRKEVPWRGLGNFAR